MHIVYGQLGVEIFDWCDNNKYPHTNHYLSC